MACDLGAGTNRATTGVCLEKQLLLEAFTAAIRELLLIQNQQFRAVVSNDPDFARFDILLEMATAKKRQAKYAYLKHAESHGC